MDILLSEWDEKPDGWEAVPYVGGEIYYDPSTTDEGDVVTLAYELDNGNIEKLAEAVGVEE
jgi:hypothetical protein